MKHFFWLIGLVLLAGAPCTYAQSVTTTRTVFETNFSGDNLVSQFWGPGVNLTATGGTNCFDWCSGDSFSNTPGTSLTPGSEIFYGSVYGTLTFEGHNICTEQFHCFISDASAGIGASQSLTFPTNGQDFTVRLPAGMGPVDVNFYQPGTGALETVNLGEFGGEMVLSFQFVPEFPGGPPPYYLFERATFTSGFAAPEPGPLGLMAAGLAGLLGLVLKRRLLALPESR